MGVLSDEGKQGIHPDLIAPLFGFDSGDAMVRAMVSARGKEALIAAEAKVRLRDEHPDLLPTRGEISEKAQQAIHGKERAAVLREELVQLGRKVGTETSTKWAEDQQGAMRAAAEKQVGSEVVGKIRVDRYRQAERTAAGRALELARKAAQAHAGGRTKDADRMFGEAYIEKRREALNYELGRAAQNQRDAATKRIDGLKKLTQPAAQERVGKAGGGGYRVDYPDGTSATFPDGQAAQTAAEARPGSTWQSSGGFLEQMNALLERFNLRPKSPRQAQRRATLEAWAAVMKEAGEPIDLPEIPPEDGRQRLEELTVDELTAVHDAVQQIAKLASDQNKLLGFQGKATLRFVRDQLVKSIDEKFTGDAVRNRTGRGPFDQVADGLGRFWTSLESLGDIVKHIDGGEDGGVMASILKHPFDEAANRRAALEAADTERLHELFATWEKHGRSRLLDQAGKVEIKAIDQSLTRLQRIMVAIQMGNEGNKARLLKGENWTEDQAKAVLDTLDAHDGALVQGILDTVGAHRSALFDMQQRIIGTRPEAVDASPVTIGGKTFKGGYFPIIYDELKSASSAREKLKEAAEMVRSGAFGAAKPNTGNLKSRGEGTGRQLLLDLTAVDRSLQRVYSILAYREPLIDATRILRQDEVRNAIESRYGKNTMLALDDAMVRIAGADIRDRDGAERFVGWLQKNGGMAAMAWNVWTAVQNVTGVTQAMERVGTLRFIRAMAPMVGDAGNQQSLRAFILQHSPLMRRRFKLSGERIKEETATGIGAIGRDAPDALRPFAMMNAIDQLVAMPTWKAAYDHAMEDSHGHAKAVLMAEQAVTDALSGQDVKDKAAIFESGALAKALTTFGSYFNRTENLRRQAFRRTGADSIKGFAGLAIRPADAIGLAWSMSLLYALPVAMTAAGLALLRPDQRREKKSLPGRLTADSISMLLAGIPALREASAGVQGQNYSGPAGMRGFDTINHLLTQVRQGKADKGLGHALVDAFGLVSGLPTVQAQRTLDGLLYDTKRNAANPLPPLFGAPK